MDRHDPERRVALYVDEWGVWFAPRPHSACGQETAQTERAGWVAGGDRTGGEDRGGAIGDGATSSGSQTVSAAGITSLMSPSPEALLEQPCTLREALVCALCIHAMIGQCERVQLANLAQAVNVLHAPLRTSTASGAASNYDASNYAPGIDGAQLVKTPTFHALCMLSPHMESQRLPAQLLHAMPYTAGATAVPRLSCVVSEGGADSVGSSAGGTEGVAVEGGGGVGVDAGRRMLVSVVHRGSHIYAYAFAHVHAFNAVIEFAHMHSPICIRPYACSLCIVCGAGGPRAPALAHHPGRRAARTATLHKAID